MLWLGLILRVCSAHITYHCSSNGLVLSKGDFSFYVNQKLDESSHGVVDDYNASNIFLGGNVLRCLV